MTKRFTNNTQIPLSMAVFLASSHYDFSERPEKSISASDFSKSIRQYILQKRMDGSMDAQLVDIVALHKSKLGSSLHESIENVWLDPERYKEGMAALGYPQRVIDRIEVNNPLAPQGSIPMWFEVRGEKVVNGWTVSGKFDCVSDGVLEDYKSTGTFSYGSGNDWKYINQGSIYKLIHSNIITQDYMRIIWFFTNWQANQAIKNKDYPQQPIMEHKLALKTEAETIRMITDFTNEIERHWDTPEPDLPLCSDVHLWRKDPIYKVYKDENAKRAMTGGTFDTFYAAQNFASMKGGIVKTIPAPAGACGWCSAATICSQKKAMDAGL